MGVISTRKVGDVLVVSANNPPVNALSHPVRVGLRDAIQEAARDNTIKAIVVACEGRTFFAGADITEFGKGAGSLRRSTARPWAGGWKLHLAAIIGLRSHLRSSASQK